jgi:anti-sigma B factor antagonist
MIKIEQRIHDNILIVSLEGNMAGSCEAEELHSKIDKWIIQGNRQIILDLSKVHWMGSLCTGAIMREIISLRKRGGDMFLAGLSRKVQRIFQITKLDSVIKIYPTIAEAIKGFGAPIP